MVTKRVIDVDTADRADGKVPAWDTTSGTHIYVPAGAVADITDIPVAETDTSLRFAPDGAGAGEWVSGGFASGTGFPGSPAAGDVFFRTDRGLFYYYDGTRWLTTTLYEWMVGWFTQYSATTTLDRFPIPTSSYSLYGVDFAWAYYIAGGTHDASKYWTLKIADTGGGDATTLTSDKATINGQVTPAATAIGAVINAAQIMELTLTKVSTPSPIIVASRFRYRLVG